MFYLDSNHELQTSNKKSFSDDYQTGRTSIDELYQWLDRPVTEEEVRTVDFEQQ
ncbi:MAG: hypothetical protein OQK73_11960 [Gammaproteobacteria bacterium]|nr:hypothetical protein [Gammaproteobacteria bacterium]